MKIVPKKIYKLSSITKMLVLNLPYPRRSSSSKNPNWISIICITLNGPIIKITNINNVRRNGKANITTIFSTLSNFYFID